MQACLNPGGGINKERFMRRNEQICEQTFEQTLEVLCKHYLQHVPNIDSFREERWLQYMSKINENLYNIYIFMLQMIHLYFFNVHHLAKNNTSILAHIFLSIFLESKYKRQNYLPVVKMINVQINKFDLCFFPFINHSS